MGRNKMWVILFMLCLAALPQTPLSASEAGRGESAFAVIWPGQTIQTVVERHPPGTTFYLWTGEYRMQRIEPRDGDRFIGAGPVVLNGSRRLTSFVREGEWWVATGQTQEQDPHGYADPAHPRAVYSEQLFLDDEPLRHVASKRELTEGAWYFDYDADKIYMADDPTGRNVETSVTDLAFDNTGNGVTVRGLTIEKYANRAQVGAVYAGEDWLVQDNEIRLNHGAGIDAGDRTAVIGNYVHRNGHLGVAGGGDDLLVEGNEIAYNNTAGFDVGWEAGGGKWTETNRLTVRGNYVHHNFGPGLWTDIDTRDTVYEGNWVYDNESNGIQHEISFDAVIRNNVVSGNGADFDVWVWGSQILIQNSQRVEVIGNWVYVNERGNAIGIINQDREGHVAKHNVVRDNDITLLADGGTVGAATDNGFEDVFATNRFDGNRYHIRYPDNDHWLWSEGEWIVWSDFRAHGQEANGTIDDSVALPPPPWTMP